jgi:hypothetical protein
MSNILTYEEFCKAREEIRFNLGLYESLDSNVEVTYKPIFRHDGNNFKIGTFTVNNKEYRLIFESIPNIEYSNVSINFERVLSDGRATVIQTDDLSKTEVLSVFATVVHETKKYFNKYDIIEINPNSAKKAKVYMAVAKKLTDDEHGLISHDDGSIVITGLNPVKSEYTVVDKILSSFKHKWK